MAGPKGSCTRHPSHPRVASGRQPGSPTFVDWKVELRAERAGGLEEAQYMKPKARGHHGTTGTSDGGTFETLPDTRGPVTSQKRYKEKGQHPTRGSPWSGEG